MPSRSGGSELPREGSRAAHKRSVSAAVMEKHIAHLQRRFKNDLGALKQFIARNQQDDALELEVGADEFVELVRRAR